MVRCGAEGYSGVGLCLYSKTDVGWGVDLDLLRGGSWVVVWVFEMMGISM